MIYQIGSMCILNRVFATRIFSPVRLGGPSDGAASFLEQVMKPSNIKRLEERLGREFRFAAQQALNDAAFEIRSGLGRGADRSFDKGATVFTQRGFAVSKRATKTDLTAVVEAKPIQSEYLQKPVFAGTRRVGDYATAKTGIVVPGASARKAKTGSLPRGYIKRQLAQPDVFGGVIKMSGAFVKGVFQRPKRRGRVNLGPLKVLALFRDKVVYRKHIFDVVGIAESDFTQSMQRSMKRAVDEINRFGRVRTAKQRKDATSG